MNNGEMDRGNETPTQVCLVEWGKPRKPPVRLVGTGIRTRDLPNASLVRYHGATSLGINKLLNHIIIYVQRILFVVK